MSGRAHSPGSMAGFTVVELIVVVAIAAVLLLVGVPSFVELQRNSELTSVTNGFIAAVNAARGEAMKRARHAMVVPADGQDWNNGWQVFVDQDGDGAFGEGDVLLQEQRGPAGYVTVSGTDTAKESPPYVLFDASGYTKTKAAGFTALTMTFVRNDLETDARLAQSRRVVIARTGRARSCRPSTDTSCVSTAQE